MRLPKDLPKSQGTHVLATTLSEGDVSVGVGATPRLSLGNRSTDVSLLGGRAPGLEQLF